ncbi:MAG: hypothetical protein JXR77_02725 [Lentisphaeria bacterium]|nr:hypothetical protein [Lentisphaeria bacterium]
MEDRLHWSFGDGSSLAGIVFRDGFSAAAGTLPEGPFDPAADWEQAYDVVYTQAKGTEEDAHVYYGSLRLRKNREDGRCRLQVRARRQTGQKFASERMLLTAECLCRIDPPLALMEGASWRVDTHLINQRDPETRPFAAFREEGRLRGDAIEKKGPDGNWYGYRVRTAGLPLLSDWSLMAAVATLPRDREWAFDLLRELESFHPRQRIRFLETFEARFGQRAVRLHGYVHVGEGTVPSFYWVDDAGRLLLVRTALSALVYNPRPRLEEEAP